MIIASFYSKPVNKSIAFHYGQKNNGYSAFIPNTRYLVYQPRLTDALIVICQLLSYEHPCKPGVFHMRAKPYVTSPRVSSRKYGLPAAKDLLLATRKRV